MTLTAPRRALRRRRLARAGTLSAALLLALTACGGRDAEPAPSPTTTPTASPTASASAPAAASEESPSAASSSPASGSGTAAAGNRSTDPETGMEFETTGTYVPASKDGPAQNVPKPVMPEAMKQDTPEGAEAAVRYWWEAVYYLQQTNDAEPMLAASTEDCEACAVYAKTISRIYDEGYWYTGSRPSSASTLSQEVEGDMIVTSLIDFDAATGYDNTGSIVPRTQVKEVQNQPWRHLLTWDAAEGIWRMDTAESPRTASNPSAPKG